MIFATVPRSKTYWPAAARVAPGVRGAGWVDMELSPFNGN
jgi:hypothetical protein